MKKIIPFNYFGGKYMHLDFILKRLPETKSYVEVFGGSGVVLLNRKPSNIETFNDINSTIVNFFKVLREKRSKLINQIYLTPYSREEYQDCYKQLHKGNDVERARRFFVVVNQSFNGTYSRQTGWKISTKNSRVMKSEAINRWLSKIPNLEICIDRLRSVQISNYDFRLMFKKFDGPNTLFYCDPPYLHQTRCNNNEYEFEMNDEDHKAFLLCCRNAKGLVAVSCYENDLYNEQLPGFYKTVANKKATGLMHSVRQEVLYTNYDPDHFNKNLFNNN